VADLEAAVVELKDAVANPASLASKGSDGIPSSAAAIAGNMAALAARRLVISKLQPTLEPATTKLGYEWDDVSRSLESIESIVDLEAAVAELKDAVVDPASLESGPLAGKLEELALGQATAAADAASSLAAGPNTGFQIEAASLPPHFKRLHELFFDKSSKQNVVCILNDVAKDFLGVVTNAAKLIYQVANLVRKCLPPHFPVVTDVTKDIGMLIMDLNFKLRSLPFKLAKSLRQILLIPRDMLRFAGSVRSLIVVMRASFSNSACAIDLQPQLKRLEGKDGTEDDTDAELSSAPFSEDDITQVMGIELAEAAGEATTAAALAEELPDEPPPGLKVSIEDEDGAGRATVMDEEAATEDMKDGDEVDDEDEDQIEGDTGAPQPQLMERERRSFAQPRLSRAQTNPDLSAQTKSMKTIMVDKL